MLGVIVCQFDRNVKSLSYSEKYTRDRPAQQRKNLHSIYTRAIFKALKIFFLLFQRKVKQQKNTKNAGKNLERNFFVWWNLNKFELLVEKTKLKPMQIFLFFCYFIENIQLSRKHQFERIYGDVSKCLRWKCSTIGSGFDHINIANA